MGCAGLLFGFNKMTCGMYGWTMYFTVKKDKSATTPGSKFINDIPWYIDCLSRVRFTGEKNGVS
jgi:hypothetical protein